MKEKYQKNGDRRSDPINQFEKISSQEMSSPFSWVNQVTDELLAHSHISLVKLSLAHRYC